jgi:hypothetical protein
MFRGPDYRIVNAKLNEFLNKLITGLNSRFDRERPRSPIVLVKANHVCPREWGVQGLENRSTFPRNAKEPGGYCSAWSMFFAELCFKNPEIPSRLIYESIMKKGELYRHQPNYFKRVIRGYTCFINKKIVKYFGKIDLMMDGIPTNSKTIVRTIKKHDANKGSPTFEYRLFHDKMLDIMEVELNIDEEDSPLDRYDEYPRIKEIYHESKLNRNIKSDTSSSDLEYNKVRSPKRVIEKRKIRPRSISDPLGNLFEEKEI